jgi:hypothetical protein
MLFRTAAPSRSQGVTTMQRFGQMEMIETGLMNPKVVSGDRRAAFARETAQQLHNQSAAEPAINEARKPDTTLNEAA